MMTAFASLVFAGAIAAQSPNQGPPPLPPSTPVAPVAPAAPAAPLAPLAPLAPFEDFDFQFDFNFDQSHFDFNFDKNIKEQVKAVRAHSKEIAEQARAMKLEALSTAGQQLAELGQFPVPPVPPVPPRDPREKPRERERRRIPNGWVESTEPFSRTINVSKGATLLVTNIAGNIQVVPGTADRIEIEALKHSWGPNPEEAKTRLADAVVETFVSGNRVEVRVEHGGRRDPRNVDVEIHVKVPADAAVDLRSVSGDIRVMNVKGEVRVQNVSGNLGLEGTARLAAVKTVSGDLTLTNAGSDTQLSLSTVNGDVMVQGLTARTLDVNTVNGDLRIAGWTGDRAYIRTLDGDQDLQISLVKGGRYEIESHSGDIQLSLPEQPGFEMETHTFSGRIRIDFPIKSEGPIRDNDRGPRSIRGTYGDGSSSLRLQTFDGDLTVTRR
jgi:hypothetical protein